MSAVIDNIISTSSSNIAGLMSISSTFNVGKNPIPSAINNIEPYLRISIPDFQYEFNLPIIRIELLEEQSICEVRLLLINEAHLILRLSGDFTEYEGKIFVRRIEQFIIEYELKTNRSLQRFVACTFMGMFSLANTVLLDIPETISITSTFGLPLKEISQTLQTRQLAYRIMVIEKALGIDIPMPTSYISNDNIKSISYSYHSIIERSFDWEYFLSVNPVPAIQEVLDQFPKKREVAEFASTPSKIIKNIFGKDINLGYHKATIENAVIENYEEAKRELEKLDGHTVDILIRSLNGRIKVESIDTPRLPENAWDERIQQLINLDSQLSLALANRYHALAAATLDGLTEEQKIAITARPELDETAFMSED